MHEPLHWGMASNDFGRNITVRYEGNESSLYVLWESTLPQDVAKEEARLAREAAASFEKRQDSWKHQLFPRNLKFWGEELVRKACHTIYDALRAVPTPEPGIEHAPGVDQLKNPFDVDRRLFAEWKREVSELLVLAAQRTAFSVLDILEHRRHALHHKEGRGRHHVKKYWYRSLAMNLGIAVTVAPLFLLIARWHAGHAATHDDPGAAAGEGRKSQ